MSSEDNGSAAAEPRQKRKAARPKQSYAAPLRALEARVAFARGVLEEARDAAEPNSIAARLISVALRQLSEG